DAPGQGLLLNLVVKRFATRLGELLGIVEAENGARRIKNHRRGNHRATERAAAHLVDAGDPFLDALEIQAHLHDQPFPTSSSTASAARAEASRRRVRWISSKPAVCAWPSSISGARVC